MLSKQPSTPCPAQHCNGAHFRAFFIWGVVSGPCCDRSKFGVAWSGYLWGACSQAKKRHINIILFVRLVLGFHRVCPGDKPGVSLGQTR